jgi:hypothetical protein
MIIKIIKKLKKKSINGNNYYGKHILLWILLSMIVISVIIICVYNLYNYMSKSGDVNRFLNLEFPTTTSIKQGVNANIYPNGQPQMKKYSYNATDENNPNSMNSNIGCKNNTDIKGVCLNYNACCGNNPNGECFCNHPHVIKCKKTYEECIVNSGEDKAQQAKCNKLLKPCCDTYETNVNINNFKQDTNRDQEVNILCRIAGISNIEDKCIELCQTNEKCKAFGVNNYSCILYSDLDKYYLENNPNRGKSQTKYFIKK